MEPLTGKIFEELLAKGYSDDFANMAVVAAHALSHQDANDLAFGYFGTNPLPAAKSISLSQIDPMSQNGDENCIEFSIPSSSTNTDITWSMVKWGDPQNGPRVSINSLRGLVKWLGIDSIHVSKAKDENGDTIIFAAKKGTTVVLFMDKYRYRP